MTSSTQADVLIAILTSGQAVCISFDPLTHKVTNVDAVSTDE
jgi:hypothetical protein